MSAIGIIPARWASTRFPGKPLAKLAGRPMLEHVWRAAKRASSLRDVIVATDDDRIEALCHELGARVARTASHHETGTDRIAEVARDLEDEIIVNIQGDEPLLQPFVIDRAVEALVPGCEMATLAHRADPTGARDPQRVKVVLDVRGRALYFSRASIPASKAAGDGLRPLQHIGLYVYRREFLTRFVALPRGVLEQQEGLEQLRALEHGYRIQVALLEDWQSMPVDVPEDVPFVERMLAQRAS